MPFSEINLAMQISKTHQNHQTGFSLNSRNIFFCVIRRKSVKKIEHHHNMCTMGTMEM